MSTLIEIGPELTENWKKKRNYLISMKLILIIDFDYN